MTVFYDLSIPLRSLLILTYFLTTCAGGCLIPLVFRRNRILHRILVPAGVLVSAAVMVILTAQARSNLRNLALPPASDWLCRQPLAYILGWILLVIGYFVYMHIQEWRFRKNTITRSSIKEGVDKISSGMCFYSRGGRVILVNRRMNELSHIVAGGELQNGELFWQILSGGTVCPDVERLAFGSYPEFRLADGTVWIFTREKLAGFYQLTAVDTTLQQSLTDELREKNLDLAAMNLRLRRYGNSVDELARARERLETKVRIHGELGQALLATRRYLMDPGSQEIPLEIWRRNIAILHKEMETQKTGDPLQILRKAAQSAGITLEIRGELPENTECRQFFLTAASEAMTNAVLHANAKTLSIDLEQSGGAWKMRFGNDGAKPSGPVTEGGGLSSLRRKAEYIGAGMTVESEPEFVLTIEGGKGKSI